MCVAASCKSLHVFDELISLSITVMTQGTLEQAVAFSAVWTITIFVLITVVGTISLRQVSSDFPSNHFSQNTLEVSIWTVHRNLYRSCFNYE
jgi:hypothetical protein